MVVAVPIFLHVSHVDDPLDAFQNVGNILGSAVGVVFFTATGAFIGGFIGGMTKSVVWLEVPLSYLSAAEVVPAMDSREVERIAIATIDQGVIPDKYRWSCNVSSGAVSSLLSNDIEQAMIRSGFNVPVLVKEVKPGYYRSEQFSYPGRDTDPSRIGLPLSLQLNYFPKPYYFLSLLMLYSTLATVSGHRSNPEIFISLKVRSIALCSLVMLMPNNGEKKHEHLLSTGKK